MTMAAVGVQSVPQLMRLDSYDLSGQRVLIRVDMNVPLSDGQVTSDERIRAHLPTIRYVLEQGGGVILLSHLGRPEAGTAPKEFSLQPVAMRLAELLGKAVRFDCDYLNHFESMPGEVVLCENTRFNVGETTDDKSLAKKLALLGDIFVMDAFAAAHRAHASTHAIVKFMAHACAGFLLLKELDALQQVLQNPRRPVVAVLGGAKISTKLGVIESLVKQVDCIIPGGGIANTLLLAQGFSVGSSLCQRDMLVQAQQVLDVIRDHRCDLQLPVDAICASRASDAAEVTVYDIGDIPSDQMILDVGPQSCKKFMQTVSSAGTIIWNGPLGVFEKTPFATGTRQLAEAISRSKAYSLAGGGDTLAAIEKFNVGHAMSYISTGGGAFLEFIEGKRLPAIEILKHEELH